MPKRDSSPGSSTGTAVSTPRTSTSTTKSEASPATPVSRVKSGLTSKDSCFEILARKICGVAEQKRISQCFATPALDFKFHYE